MKIDEAIAGIIERIEAISIDEIKEILQPFMAGMEVTAPQFLPGVFIYRARKLDSSIDKQNVYVKDLHYKRLDVGLGRANREGCPVFYASQGKEAVFYEMRAKKGDELLIGNWQLKEQLLVQPIGYTAQVFSDLGATRLCPVWQQGGDPRPQSSMPADVQKKNSEALEKFRSEDPKFDIISTFGNEFTRYDDKMYKISTAIAELHSGGQIAEIPLRFGGVLYPSIQMSANSDNFAILPWYADDHLVLKGVQHLRVSHREELSISYEEIDYAVTFEESGKVIWNGGPQSRTFGPEASIIQCLCKGGVDEFGFYNRDQNGGFWHWVIIGPATGEHVNFRQKVHLQDRPT